MAGSISRRARVSLYLRMILGAGMLGIALGYYLQIVDRIDMTPYLVFVFAVRGMIVGAFIWWFELFWVLGPNGNRLAGFSSGARFGVRVVAYLVLGEAGYWLGEMIFEPGDIADLFYTAGGAI